MRARPKTPPCRESPALHARPASGTVPAEENLPYAGAKAGTSPLEALATLGSPPPLLVLVAAFLAGSVRGYTGFGSAMIFMPVAGAYLGRRRPSASCRSSTRSCSSA
jgi:hypothetical protein